MEDLFSRKDLIYTIYREKSFSKAAQKLFISQPSLSFMVKRIEDKVGMPLFDRTSKPVCLTEAGLEYIAAVEQIRHAENAFSHYLQQLNNLEAGSLGIGSNQLLSSLVLPRYISSFTQKYPKIQLRMLDANSTTLQNEIMSGHLDIIIDTHRLPSEIFERKFLTSEQLYLAVPACFSQNQAAAAYRLDHNQIIDHTAKSISDSGVPLSYFAQVPFILMNRDNDTRQQTNAIFQSANFSPKVLFEMDRLATLYAYIETGAAASVVSDTLIRNIRGVDHSSICYYPLPTALSQRNIYVSYKRNKYYSKAMGVFIDSLDNFG